MEGLVHTSSLALAPPHMDVLQTGINFSSQEMCILLPQEAGCRKPDSELNPARGSFAPGPMWNRLGPGARTAGYIGSRSVCTGPCVSAEGYLKLPSSVRVEVLPMLCAVVHIGPSGEHCKDLTQPVSWHQVCLTSSQKESL